MSERLQRMIDERYAECTRGGTKFGHWRWMDFLDRNGAVSGKSPEMLGYVAVLDPCEYMFILFPEEFAIKAEILGHMPE